MLKKATRCAGSVGAVTNAVTSQHAVVKATEYDAPMNVVVATIPGDASTNEEFHLTAHLFEGVAKQGANTSLVIVPPRFAADSSRASTIRHRRRARS